MEPIEALERSGAPPAPGREARSREARSSGTTPELGRCQMRSETDSPCGRPAATEVMGVLLCERCSREQEAYFAIGELTQVPRGSLAGPRRGRRTDRALRSGGPAGPRRRLRRVATAGGRASLLSIVLASLLAAAACGLRDSI